MRKKETAYLFFNYKKFIDNEIAEITHYLKDIGIVLGDPDSYKESEYDTMASATFSFYPKGSLDPFSTTLQHDTGSDNQQITYTSSHSAQNKQQGQLAAISLLATADSENKLVFSEKDFKNNSDEFNVGFLEIVNKVDKDNDVTLKNAVGYMDIPTSVWKQYKIDRTHIQFKKSNSMVTNPILSAKKSPNTSGAPTVMNTGAVSDAARVSLVNELRNTLSLRAQ